MAYLTKYNLSKLCQSVEITCKIDLDMFLQNIYDDKEIYYILNRIEIEYLFKYKMMLKDEKKFFVEYYKEIPEREDTKTFVFNKGGKTKYHLTNECKLLKKDYLDFNIPSEIQDLGDTAIDEYRNWFMTNNYGERHKNGEISKEKIIRDFNLKYPSKYKIKPIEDNSNLLIIEIPNSNNKSVKKEFNIQKSKEKIKILKEKWYNSFQCKVSRTFAKFKHLLKKSDTEIEEKMTELFSDKFVGNYGMDNLKKKFEISKKLNNQIISELLEYFKWTYKIENKDFDNLTLEKFGLECCNSCIKESKNVLQHRI